MTLEAIIPTGTSQKEAWHERSLPPVEEIARGVWSIPVPCAEFSIRYTLAYLIANDAGEFVLVDPGWNGEEGRRHLLAGIHRTGLDLARMVGVVATHFHPDHIALADVAPPSAWLAVHPIEARYLADRPGLDEWLAGERTWLSSLGVPDDALESVSSTIDEVLGHNVAARPDLLLDDGDLVPLPGRTLRVIWTPGHTAGHLCLALEDERLLLTGDHFLPRISPNVGAHWFDGRRDSVGQYLSSLTALLQWEDYEVCPAHEYRFRGVRTRVEQLIRHQAERAAEVAGVQRAQPDATPWEIAGRLHWSRSWENLDPLNRRAALGETVAQLIHLGHRVALAIR